MHPRNLTPRRAHARARRTTPIIKLIRWSDMLLEVADARYPDLSRNRKLEERIQREGRRFALVFNKADLVSAPFAKKLQARYPGAFLVSARTRQGLSRLRTALAIESRKREMTVGVIGYPNTGKSSLINVLKGARAARTSSRAGFTRGLQKVRMSPEIMLWDTPGVTPFGEDEERLALLGAKMPEQLHDAEGVALTLLRTVRDDAPGLLSHVYGVAAQGRSEEDLLEAVARSLGTLKRGGVPDIEQAARRVIHDWQKGKFKMWELKRHVS